MKSKGVHRLSIGVGLLAAVTVFLIVLVESANPFAVPFIWAVIEVIAFILGWGAVRLGAWIVAGFAEDRTTEK